MMMPIYLDAAIAVLLVVAIGYMFALNRRLVRMRDARHLLQPAIEEFSGATKRAQDSVDALKAQTAALRGSVKKDAGKVSALRDCFAGSRNTRASCR